MIIIPPLAAVAAVQAATTASLAAGVAIRSAMMTTMHRHGRHVVHDAGGDWRDMASAPRDGTTIEVRCTYGIAPWYGLYKWAAAPYGGTEGWRKVSDENSSFTEDPSFSWRPYDGDPGSYVDPTGGAQNTRNYWLRAAGYPPAPHGHLPFEEEPRLGTDVSAHPEAEEGPKASTIDWTPLVVVVAFILLCVAVVGFVVL